jgi:3-dehydroquinate dehydratase-2
MTKSIAIMSGPSLNILGEREPEIYGHTTLPEIEQMCIKKAKEVGAEILFFRQSNHEGVLIDWIQEARGKAGGLIINPAGFTSTSIAILDALKTFDGPIMEVHLTNIHKREHFRQPSYVSLAATGVIAGLGPSSYTAAVEALAGLLK